MKRAPRKMPAAPGRKPVWVFKLYVAGTTPKSLFIYTNLKEICKEYLHSECRIKVIDILKTPLTAKKDQIVAIPTLICKYPLPDTRFIGDLTDTEKVVARLYQLR